jgi:hypothetical protein
MFTENGKRSIRNQLTNNPEGTMSVQSDLPIERALRHAAIISML